MAKKKHSKLVAEFATLTAFSGFTHRADGEPILPEENASLLETYALVGRMLQELAAKGATAGSKVLVTFEVVKEAAPKPKPKAKSHAAK